MEQTEKPQTILLDAGVAAGLGLALLLVIVLDRLLPVHKLEAPEPVTTTQTTPPRPLQLAVTPPYEEEGLKWDDMGQLLKKMGKGYQFTEYPLKELHDFQKLAQFDVLFLTCGRGGSDPDIRENLQKFVNGGGTLYASDWRFEWVAQAFPDYCDFRVMGEGRGGQTVPATVVDAGLRDLVGPTIPLYFNLSRWKTAAFGGDRVQVLVRGEYQKERGGRALAPLLVKFKFGKGTVIFTSFHNEIQNSAIETKLLKYLVFSAVTARMESQVTQTMIKGGFSPQKSNLLSASGNSEITHIYKSQKKGKLRFVLGFENRGARLRLTVTGPDGKVRQEEGTQTIAIDVADAQAGDWRYTVTAQQVPYADFPFTLTVGESD